MGSTRGWLFLALAIEATIALVGVQLTGVSLSSLLIVGPLLVSMRVDARAAMVFTFFAVALAVAMGMVDGTLGTADHALHGVSVAVGGGFAILTARMRTERECALAHVTRIAELTQRAVLRPIPSVIGGVAFAAYYQSATHRALLGGDLYDTALTPSGLRLIVGDAKGKGLDAVHLAAAVLGRFREIAYAEPDLVRLAKRLDTCLKDELGGEDFVTILLAEFVPGEVRLVNCGHHPPLRVGHRLDFLAPPIPAPPLGLHPDPVLQRVRLAANERLLIYTDGLVEARDSNGVMFPLDHQVRSALTAPSLQEAVGALQRRVLRHSGNNLRDDLVLILAQPAIDHTADHTAGAPSSNPAVAHDVPKPCGQTGAQTPGGAS